MEKMTLATFIVEPEHRLKQALDPLLGPDYPIISVPNKGLLFKALQEHACFLPAVILIDSKIKESPIQLLRDIKRDTYCHDVIVLADKVAHEVAIDAMQSCASDYLTPPHEITQLSDLIRTRVDNLLYQSSINLFQYTIKHGVIERQREKRERLLHSRLWAMKAQNSAEYQRLEADFDTRARFSLKGTVLIVDDELYFRRTLQFFLEPNFTILVAEDGLEALDVLKAHPETDVVLLDVRMPRLNGNEAIPQIRALNPHVQVVMLTAFKDTDIAIQSMKLGACDYLNKPSKQSIIMEKVQNALKIKQLSINHETEVPYYERIKLFDDLWESAEEHGKTLLYHDLYLFFPEASHYPIAATMRITDADMHRGAEPLVDAIIHKSKAIESLEEKALMAKFLNGAL